MVSGRGYRAVLTHPVAGRLAMADAVSVLGDFVGLGALLLLAYDRAGGAALGPALVFAVQALPALLAGTVGGPFLDRIGRRAALVGSYLAGAGAVLLPLLLAGLAAALLGAALLGMLRAVTVSVRSAVLAEAVPRPVRGRLQAIFAVSFQVSQVLGFAAGAGVAVLVGPRAALVADVVTFVAAALLLRRLRLPTALPRDRSPSPGAGLAAIFANPALAVLAPVTWVGLTAGGLPETLAPVALSPAHRAWLPWTLSAAPAGTALAAVLVGRSRLPERLRAQFRYLAACGVAFAATGLLLGRHPAFLLAGNLAVGLGSGWLVAAQTTFANLAPPRQMAQVTATMIASLVVLEGVGAVGFAWVAGRWGVGPAYLAVGAVLLVTGLTAQRWTPVELTAKGGVA
jgi:predicted MFS family arabinose efflux permease